MKSRHYIAGIEVNPPINSEAVGFRIDFDQEQNTQVVSTTSNLIWGVSEGRDKADAYNILKEVLSKGLLGGVGITEGVPYQHVLDSERGQKRTLFNGYIDLFKSKWKTGHETSVEAPIQVAGGLDWLRQTSNSISFDYLESIGAFNSDSFIPVDYCIDKSEDMLELFILGFMLYGLITRLQDEIAQISTILSFTADPFAVIAVVIALAVHVAVVVGLLIAIVLLIQKFFEFIIQRTKIHYCMYVREQFEIGLKHFGLTLKSSILQGDYSDLILMPEKYRLYQNNGKLEGLTGLIKKNKKDQKGYYKGTFGDFILAWKDFFNAKIIIDGNLFYFEPDGFRLGGTGFEISDIYDKETEFNHQDFVSTTVLTFATDQNDKHTINEFSGTSVQVMQLPKAVVNQNMRLTGGSKTISLPCALAKRKARLSPKERIAKELFKIVQDQANIIVDLCNYAIDLINTAIQGIKKIIRVLRSIGIRNVKEPNIKIQKISRVSITDLIQNRVGMIKMESDSVQIPKVFFLDQGGKLHKQDFLNARYIYDRFHSRRLFVSTNGRPPYQYLLRSAQNIPFTFNDFDFFLKNNAIFTKDGEGEAISLEFYPEKQTANIDYKILKQYTNNIELKYIEPDGN